MRFLKTTLPVSVAFITALMGVAVYFSPHPISQAIKTELSLWGRLVGVVMLFIGVYSILRLHLNRVRRGQPGWGYSALFFLFFGLISVFGVLNVGPARDEHGQVVKDADGNVVTAVQGPLRPRTTSDDAVAWAYRSIAVPASSTMFAILGFFICSAAYRTFRAKTAEAAALLLAALVVMLGQVPLPWSVFDGVPVVSNWLLDVPNMAVKRAILFGVCLGAVGTALRVMFGIERSYLGGDK